MLISLFIACYNDTLFPETGKAVVRLLERLGHTVEFRAAQTCCGQMHYNTGYRPEAVSLMRHFIEVFRGAETICIPSASCVSMIRDHFPRMAAEAGLQNEVDDLLPRVFEFTELLVDKLGVVDTGANYPHTVTLHTSCHSLRSLHIGDRPRLLLKAVRGLELIELSSSDQCCGFGGTFAIKNAEVSSAMLSEKVRGVLNTRAEAVTGCDNSCLMHIGGALHRERTGVTPVHLAEILAGEEGGQR